jgi:hypothetical protein
MYRLIAVLLMAFSANAYAVLPQALTVVLHFVGGYVVTMAADKAGYPGAGIPLATGIGFAKEVSDLNFNGPDFIAWPLGGMLYMIAKEHPEWCWKDESEPLWYAETYQCERK